MLARRHRLSTAEIAEIAKQGRRLAAGPLAVKYRAGQAGAPARFAFLVAAKQVRRAVDRHKLKRRAAEALQKALSPAFPSLDVLIYLPAAALIWKPSDWDQAIKNLIIKL